MLGFRQFLSEAKVDLGGGAKYGQIVLLMGGAGSGKSTATRRFYFHNLRSTIDYNVVISIH